MDTLNGVHLDANLFEGLPMALVGEILSFLDSNSARRCLLVCKSWKDFILVSEEFWKSMSTKRWKVDPVILLKVSKKRSWKEVFLICERNRLDCVWDDATEGISVENGGKTAERNSHRGMFPRVLTRKRFDCNEGGLFQVLIEAPVKWVLNKMSVGITASGDSSSWSTIGLEDESYGIGVDILSAETLTNSCVFKEGSLISLKNTNILCGDVIGFVLDVQDSLLYFLKNGEALSISKIINWPSLPFYAGASLASYNKLTIIDQQEYPIPYLLEEVEKEKEKANLKRKLDSLEDVGTFKIGRSKQFKFDEQ